MDTSPPYKEQIKGELTRKDLFKLYFHLDEEWDWEITQEGADLAKKQFIQSVKEALVANEPISWRLLLQVLYEYLGLNVDIKTGVGAFPHMRRMVRLLDFDLSKEEEQYGLASLMMAARESRDPHSAPQNVRYDLEQDAISFFIRCPLSHSSNEAMQAYLLWDLGIQNASSKEKRKLIRLKITIEDPSQDIQDNCEALKV